MRANPSPLGANAIGETAVTADDRTLSRRAEMMVPGKALVAREAAMRRPAKPDLLADLQRLRFGAER